MQTCAILTPRTRAAIARAAVAGAAWALVAAAALPVAAQSSFTRGSTPWPDVPPPPRGKVEWVSDDMRVNGIPMKVQTFETPVSKEEVVAYYVAHWKMPNQPALPGRTVAAVTEEGRDTLVARTHGPYYSLVKVRTAVGGGASGTISTSQLLGVEPKIDASGIPSPASASAVNVVEAIDNGKRNKQVLLVTRDSLDSVAAYYQQRMAAGGWALLQQQDGKPTATQGRALVRMYGKATQQLDLALGVDAERGLTVINANLISY